ncbi:MAG: phosphohydrolase [Dehalococcoidales bacterium]|nr:phosphohydrolase [Dehalococcoidales bacterium]|tara:strand:- start:586 stop:1101 length:516 start_codon:yes stop_codon:yes gene_type:complete
MNVTKAALIQAMEVYFGRDTKRINHAHKVAGYAEALLKEDGGDYSIVIAAALLHDIGIHAAERKYGSTSGKYQEKEGPPIARQILSRLGFKPVQIEEVCGIIAHHHSPGKVSTYNFKILYDADWLVNLRDEYDIQDRSKLSNIINRLFLTSSGKVLARKVYLSEPSHRTGL